MPRPRGFAVAGQFIRSRRENANLTQEALASRCGLTRTLVQKAERGGPLSRSSIGAIARALEVSEDSFVVEEGWNGFVEDRVMEPFKPGSEPKIGSIWSQPRETLYTLPPTHLLVIGLRSLARVIPGYGPRTAAGARRFQRLMKGVEHARSALLELLGGGSPAEWRDPVRESADHAYLAASLARPAEYEEDGNAADAAFAVAIAMARIHDALHLELTAPAGRSTKDADYWRAVELATSACHACAHASVYLKVQAAFLRSATLDTHGVRNVEDLRTVLFKPVWEDGQIPTPLDLYLNRIVRIQYFDQASRASWLRWSRRGFD